jgi:hypothetical protein
VKIDSQLETESDPHQASLSTRLGNVEEESEIDPLSRMPTRKPQGRPTNEENKPNASITQARKKPATGIWPTSHVILHNRKSAVLTPPPPHIFTMIRRMHRSSIKFDTVKSWAEVLREIAELEKRSRSLPRKEWREINQAQQLLQRVWKYLTNMERDCDPESTGARHFLQVYGGDNHLPGPVGDFPIHNCFLLKQYRVGMQMILECPKLVQQAYVSDIDPWRRVVCRSEMDDDDGLYTGETLLHLAIGIGEVELVKFLLKNGADLNAKATGQFFMPSWIPIKLPSNPLVRFKYSVFFPVNLGARCNEYSRCYFGELPLSFAASVGSVEICTALLGHHVGTDDMALKFLRQHDRFGVEREAVDRRPTENFERGRPGE